MSHRALKVGLLVFALVFLAFGTGKVWAETVPSIAIINFTNQTLDDPQWQWLSKGLADMLVTDLSRTNKFQVVDREKIQDYIAEIGLSSSAIIDQNTALKFSRFAKVDKALFGNYRITGDQIEIQAYIIDSATQAVERVENVTGTVKDILELEKELALKIVENLEVPLTQAEIDSIQFKPTDSLDAATRFYKGLDAYDKGQYFDALREFRLAENNDPNYDKPLLFQGHVYENQGEYEHAILSFKSLAKNSPNSEFADDGLFFAAKLIFKHFGRENEALELADQLIEHYPRGQLPDSTEIMPAVRGHEATVIIRSHDMPLNSFAYLFKFYVHTKTNNFHAALEALEKAEATAPDASLHPYRTYYEWRKTRLVKDAYQQSGTVLKPSLPRVIELSPDSPGYEEDYSTDKRLKDTFVLGTEYFNWGGEKIQTHSQDKKTGEYYIHTPYYQKEDAWYSVTDEYVFAVPEGYIVTSVDIQYEGFQTMPGTVSISAGSLGDYYPYGSSTAGRKGKIRGQDRIHMSPGTRMFKLRVALWGDFAKKTNQWATINQWRLKANLIKARKTGVLRINSNTHLVAFLDSPPGTALHARAINWRTPHRECPCTFFHVPKGKHRLVVFATGKHRSVFEDGRRKETRVSVQAGETTELSIDFAPRQTNEVAGALPGWHDHVRVGDGVKRIGPGGQIFSLQLLEDQKKHYWVLWHQDFDLWFTSSSNGRAWSTPERFPAPINTQAKEGHMSIIQGENGKYYMALMSERGMGKGLYVSSSADMKRWSKPKRAATLKHVYSIPSLLQLEDGSFRVYYSNKGHEMSFVNSGDFQSWTEPVSVGFPEQDFGQVIQANTGKFWFVFSGYQNNEHPLFVASSDDGRNWGEATLIKPSLTRHNLTSFHPVILENDKSEIVLSWKRTTRIAFSKSNDGIKWSPSRAEITSSGRISYPDAPVSLIQRRDGQYMLAYVNGDQELWVSVSNDPFY